MPGTVFTRVKLKLLVGERKIVESITGDENLEIRWRLAKLSLSVPA
jgi:hypothetical protein